MPEIPLLAPSQVIKAFTAFGWEVKRQRGSHIIMTKTGALASLSIPNHKQVARGTLRELLKFSGLSIDEFLAGLKK